MVTLWPETTKFCGYFPLKYGFYFFIVFHLSTNSYLLQASWDLLDYVLNRNPSGNNCTAEETVQEDAIVIEILMPHLTIAITVFISIHILSVIFLIVGYCKAKPAMMKFYLRYSIIICVCQFIFGYIITQLVSMHSRVILLILTISYAYMLLILRTFYLQMAGKSQLMIFPSENESTIDINVAQQSIDSSSNTINNHCRTCTCYENSSPVNETIRNRRNSSNATTNSFVSNDRSSACQVEVEDGDDHRKHLNFKEEHIVFDEDQLAGHGTDIIVTSPTNPFCSAGNNSVICNQPVRKDDNRRTICENKKDTPIIYDLNQLNVGSSQILESNPAIINRDIEPSVSTMH